MSTYNGWTNYETWVTKLWMDNEQGSSEYWNDQARHARDEHALAAQLKDEHEESMPDVVGVYRDLLTSALQEVNWYEIAESLIEDNKDEEEEAA